MAAIPQRPALAHRLVERGLIDPASMDRAQATARADGSPLVQHLLDSGLVPAAELAETAAAVFGIPLLPADALDPDPALLDAIEPELLRRHRALPLDRHDGALRVAISDPANVAALDEIRFHTGLPTRPVLAEDDALGERIDRLLGHIDRELGEDVAAVEVRDAAPRAETDTPVVRYVNRLLLRAIREGASDIHIEPFETRSRIRFRRDGQLHEIATPPAGMAARLSARLKVMARLDIAEKRLPQDGRLRLETPDGDPVDFRVSSCPTLHGEKLVLRLLNSAAGQLRITDLGLSEPQLAQYRQAIGAAHGMILVTGPTGSGKTVTLYSGLRELNDASRNILTVEDPVEINLPGINQVSINPRIGLDFANTLRAFLRQDPDVVMLGEIRDRESAEIAIKAAQTGHLVLSTLHTNDAAGAITRLLSMGIPAWNIAASVNLVIAQRLVRRLCPACRQPASPPPGGWSAVGLPTATDSTAITVCTADGCNRCLGGYSGRMGIHELLPVDEAMGAAILRGESEAAINRLARAQGVPGLREVGLDRVGEGLTTLAEVDRVTRVQ